MSSNSSNATPIHLGQSRLTLEQLVDVARNYRPVELSEDAVTRMRPSQQWVADISDRMARGEPTPPIYSVNTGFGSLSGRAAFNAPEQAKELSRRLIISNSCGVGRYLDKEVVRAAMLVRASSLTKGYSGVDRRIVDTLLAMLNADVYPAIPEYGSLGASGDLIPLAQLALVMTRPEAEDLDIDSGEAFVDGHKVSGLDAMQKAGIARIVLGAKEGLGFINGTSFSTALVALALVDAENLVATSELVAGMSIEAMMGFGDAFIADLHEARGQCGQIESATAIRQAIADSRLIDGDTERDPERQPPQDAYSLRCTPQVLGPVRDTLKFVRGIVQNEINAATDNPLIFADKFPNRELKAISGGNFHAEYLAFAGDFLSIVVTEIGNIAERRLFRFNDGTLNRNLPDMLIASIDVGLDCGYMLPQYLAAALISDCKTLAHPDSVDSIPSCSNQEDHVSMGTNAARHARQVVNNIEHVIGIEVLMAAQALELRLDERGLEKDALSSSAQAILKVVRGCNSDDGRPIDHIKQDVVLYPRIRKSREIVHSRAIVKAATELD